MRFVPAGATCAHTAVIFYYGIFPETEKNLGDHGVALHHLCTWWDVLAEAARRREFFDEGTLAEVESFLNDPRAWQRAPDLIATRPACARRRFKHALRREHSPHNHRTSPPNPCDALTKGRTTAIWKCPHRLSTELSKIAAVALRAIQGYTE